MNYYLQDLNNHITVLSLLAQGIPAYKNLSKECYVNPSLPKLSDYIPGDIDDVFEDANPKNAGDADGPDLYDEDDFINGDSSESYNQKILHYFAEVLTPTDYKANDSIDFYVIKLFKVVIATKHKIFVIDFNDTPNFGKVRQYKNTEKIHNQIFINFLHELAKKPLGSYSKAIGAMQNLWVAQSQKYHLDIKPTKSTQENNKKINNPTFYKVINELLIDITHYKRKQQITNITYQDIIDFYHEVRNADVTSKTRRVQEWLFGSDNRMSRIDKYHQVMNIMKLHHNFKYMATHIKQVPIFSKPVSNILREMNKDKYMRKNDYHIAQAFKLDNGKHQRPGKHHFIGAHGTDSFCIPTILTDGVLTHNELVARHNKNFYNIGQSLGDGVYMTQLPQASKSLNYSNSYDSKYKWLIIVSVAYNKATTVNDYYKPKTPNYDFVLGDKIAPAHGYDEYVARYGSQIKPEYLMAFTKRK